MGIEGAVCEPGIFHDAGEAGGGNAVAAKLLGGNVNDPLARRVFPALFVAHGPSL